MAATSPSDESRKKANLNQTKGMATHLHSFESRSTFLHDLVDADTCPHGRNVADGSAASWQ
jgi:hypothetical protein